MVKSSPPGENQTPHIPGAIERPRLLARLEAAAQYRLILLTAPAGYGKTTLASQFARATNHPVAWHAIEERERDIPNLYEHSLAALERIAPGIRRALPEPGSHSPAELATLVAEYIWSTLSEDAFYIIDDIQHLTGFPAAETWLQNLVDRLPKTCHLILLSRTLPRLPFAELISRNEVLAFGQEELRLTEDEIGQLAHKLIEDHLSTAEMRRLVNRLDGWPAGIMLALQPLPPSFGDGMFNVGAEPEALFEALASSMLQAQLPDLRHFLLESSVLTRLTPELCTAVLGIANSGSWLNTARLQNLFLTKVPGGLVYHTLFRDFLQKQLHLTDPERFVALHRKAAEWFETRDNIDQAFDHYMAAEAVDAAREIAERAAGAYFAQGKAETLIAWSEKLSGAQVYAPNLALASATIHADRCEYEASDVQLTWAEDGFREKGDEEGVAKAYLQRARIFLQRGDNYRAIQEAEQLTDSSSVEVRGRALRVVGLAHIRLGDLEGGIRHLEKAVACYREVDLVSALSHLLQDLQFAYTRAGQLEKAGACLQEVVALRRKLGGASALALALNNLGYYYHQQNNYQQALLTFEEGLKAVAGISNKHTESYLLWSFGDLKRDLGNFEEAERLYTKALSLVPSSADPNLRAAILVSSATLRRREGRLDEAVLVAKEALAIANRHNISFERSLARLTIWTAYAHLKEPREALNELNVVVDELHEQGARFELVGALGLCAKVCLLEEDDERALHYLKSSLELADEVGSAQPLAAEITQTPALEKLAVGLRHPQLERALKALREARVDMMDGPASPEDEALSLTTYSLRVLTLGREEVIRDGTPIPSTEWRAAAAREIFLYLLFFGPKSRGEISLVFWPDSSADQVRANFHTTLHRARQALGSDVIVYNKDLYYINPDLDVWCDALQFEHMAAEARVLPSHDARAEDLSRKALALYQGEFLTSLDTEWAYTRRESLHEMYLETLIGLGHCAQARGDFRAALDTYGEALKVDPYREEVHRAIMRCYSEMGERNRVRSHLEELCRLFQQELAVEPTEETLQFARTLLN